MKAKLRHGEALSENVLVRLRPSERDRLKELAAKETRTVSAQIRHIVRQALAGGPDPIAGGAFE